MPVSENKSALLLKAEEINKRLDKIQQESHAVLRTRTASPERREDSMYYDAGASIKRDESYSPTAQKKVARTEGEQDAEKVSRGKIDTGLRKVFRNAAYNLAVEYPHMSLDDIKDKLHMNIDPDKVKDIEQKFEENMGEAELLDEIKAPRDSFDSATDADMSADADLAPDALDPTLRLERGPENLPNIQGGIQAVRLYQEGNRVGVVLYTDRANYVGPPANLLESLEKKLDDRERYLDNKPAVRNENANISENAKEHSNQLKEDEKEEKKALSPRPEPSAKKQEEEQENKHEAPKNVPKDPNSTSPY